MDVPEIGTDAGSPQRGAMPIGSAERESADRGTPVTVSHEGPVESGHRSTLESKLRSRIEKWAGEVGYWGQAANIVVGETTPTDYTTPLTAATFQLGSLSFHFDCVQDEDGGIFRVRLRGSKIPHISDRETLDRAMKETQPSG